MRTFSIDGDSLHSNVSDLASLANRPAHIIEAGGVMPERQNTLRVYHAGKLTVVSFGSVDMLDKIVVSDCREEITELIREHEAEVLAFDLTGVKLVPSGMLGMLASLGRMGIEIYLFNPSNEIRDVLEITRLNTVLQIQQVDVAL